MCKKSLFTTITAAVTGLALALAVAGPASAGVSKDNITERYQAVLELDTAELKERLAHVDVALIDQLDVKLTELRSFGFTPEDVEASLVDQHFLGLLSGLLETILNLVFGLLGSLGLVDLGSLLGGLTGGEGGAGGGLPLPDLPLPTGLQARNLVSEIPAGESLDQLVSLNQEMFASLGLMERSEQSDSQTLLGGLTGGLGGLPGLNIVQSLLDAVLGLVFSLLSSLGLIDLDSLLGGLTGGGGEGGGLPLPLPLPDLPV